MEEWWEELRKAEASRRPQEDLQSQLTWIQRLKYQIIFLVYTVGLLYPSMASVSIEPINNGFKILNFISNKQL